MYRNTTKTPTFQLLIYTCKCIFNEYGIIFIGVDLFSICIHDIYLRLISFEIWKIRKFNAVSKWSLTFQFFWQTFLSSFYVKWTQCMTNIENICEFKSGWCDKHTGFHSDCKKKLWITGHWTICYLLYLDNVL